MLRVIGLVVVVLLVLSLAHGERSGSAFARADARAESIADGLTGALADGLQRLGDIVFGPADPAGDHPRDIRDLARSFDDLARSTDTASRRTLARLVLHTCPSLGLVCRPAVDLSGQPAPRRMGANDDTR